MEKITFTLMQLLKIKRAWSSETVSCRKNPKWVLSNIFKDHIFHSEFQTSKLQLSFVSLRSLKHIKILILFLKARKYILKVNYV